MNIRKKVTVFDKLSKQIYLHYLFVYKLFELFIIIYFFIYNGGELR